jgi:hypothetical protein
MFRVFGAAASQGESFCCFICSLFLRGILVLFIVALQGEDEFEPLCDELLRGSDQHDDHG